MTFVIGWIYIDMTTSWATSNKRFNDPFTTFVPFGITDT